MANEADRFNRGTSPITSSDHRPASLLSVIFRTDQSGPKDTQPHNLGTPLMSFHDQFDSQLEQVSSVDQPCGIGSGTAPTSSALSNSLFSHNPGSEQSFNDYQLDFLDNSWMFVNSDVPDSYRDPSEMGMMMNQHVNMKQPEDESLFPLESGGEFAMPERSNSCDINKFSGTADALATPWLNPGPGYVQNALTDSMYSSQSSVNLSSSVMDVSNSGNANSVVVDNWFESSAAQNTASELRHVEKRKGKMSVDNISDRSSSTETDCDEANSAESNGDEGNFELPVQVVESRQNTICHEPTVGMVFPSEAEAYGFYTKYASRIGFKVRKGKVTKGRDGSIKTRCFYCSRQEFRMQRNKTPRYTRRQTRTGCLAMIKLKVKGQWVISVAKLDHNHELEHSGGRKSSDSCAYTSETHSVWTTNEVGTAKNDEVARCEVASSRNDCNYLGDKKLTSIEPNDCQSLLNYLGHLQTRDPAFFYTVQIDGANRIANFFWTDGRSRMDYDCFRDVLVLGTSLRIKEYDMICMPFLGLNHHHQYILFGCAFLLDQSVESFIWSIESFLKAMGQKQPMTVFSDDNQAVANAIKLVLPETQHCLGTWYIHQNAAEHLYDSYRQSGFASVFSKCVFDCQSRGEFESHWESMVNKYELGNNHWLSTLYTQRNRWSHLYIEKTFFAGIQSIQFAKSIINIFQIITGESMSLQNIAKHYEKLAKEMRNQELYEDCQCIESIPRGEVEKQAAEMYTPTMFRTFQEEFFRSSYVVIEERSNDGTIGTFKLIEREKGEYIVTYNVLDSTVECTCGKFQSIGILCSHALRVLNCKNVFYIPHPYILKRWRKDCKATVALGGNVGTQSIMPDRSLNLYASELRLKASNIITKSTPKEGLLKQFEGLLKQFETYLDKAAEELDKVLKLNPAEDLSQKHDQVGDANTKHQFEVLRGGDQEASGSIRPFVKNCTGATMASNATRYQHDGINMQMGNSQISKPPSMPVSNYQSGSICLNMYQAEPHQMTQIPGFDP
ncbi:hypothetical protein K2173_014971 [Erythroxylum novogranatense]|uniref:SWIM-type domain-containing protein n=1 Tax=Erythroxylum novogranatense TaxID=1862640 RepID=A0AAV8TWC9_9ROSI|nr:hypothetical protein K2173_014971 [Erythroxylum novogranatense]